MYKNCSVRLLMSNQTHIIKKSFSKNKYIVSKNENMWRLAVLRIDRPSAILHCKLLQFTNQMYKSRTNQIIKMDKIGDIVTFS